MSALLPCKGRLKKSAEGIWLERIYEQRTFSLLNRGLPPTFRRTSPLVAMWGHNDWYSKMKRLVNPVYGCRCVWRISARVERLGDAEGWWPLACWRWPALPVDLMFQIVDVSDFDFNDSLAPTFKVSKVWAHQIVLMWTLSITFSFWVYLPLEKNRYGHGRFSRGDGGPWGTRVGGRRNDVQLIQARSLLRQLTWTA